MNARKQINSLITIMALGNYLSIISLGFKKMKLVTGWMTEKRENLYIKYLLMNTYCFSCSILEISVKVSVLKDQGDQKDS